MVCWISSSLVAQGLSMPPGTSTAKGTVNLSITVGDDGCHGPPIHSQSAAHLKGGSVFHVGQGTSVVLSTNDSLYVKQLSKQGKRELSGLLYNHQMWGGAERSSYLAGDEVFHDEYTTA